MTEKIIKNIRRNMAFAIFNVLICISLCAGEDLPTGPEKIRPWDTTVPGIPALQNNTEKESDDFAAPVSPQMPNKTKSVQPESRLENTVDMPVPGIPEEKKESGEEDQAKDMPVDTGSNAVPEPELKTVPESESVTTAAPIPQASKSQRLQKAYDAMRLGHYMQASDIAEKILEDFPFSRSARKIIEKSRILHSRRQKLSTQLKHDNEFEKRMQDVDQASIPYVEPQKIKTHGSNSPYSQEIKAKEESNEISAMREEMQDVLVDLDFRNADLREVIRYLAEVSEINIVIDEGALLQSTQMTTQGVGMMPNMMGGMLGMNQLGGMTTMMPGQMMQNQMGMQNMQGMMQNQQMMQQGMNQGMNQGMQRQQMQQPAMQGMQNQNMQMQQQQMQNQMMQNQMVQPGMMQQGLGMMNQQAQPAGSTLVPGGGTVPTYQAPAAQEAQSPKVTIYLKQVPLLTSLDIILRTKGLKFKIEKDFIWISTEENLAREEMVTRIYTIQHAIGDFESFAAEGLDLSALSLGGGLTDDVTSRFMNQTAGTSAQTTMPQQDQQTQAEAAEDLISTLKKIVPQPSGASMTMYHRTGKLIVRNSPSNLRVLEGILRNLDVSSLQVSIEVRLIEISSTEGLDLGVLFSWEKENTEASGPSLTKSAGFNLPLQGFSNAITTSDGEGVTLVFDKIASQNVNAKLEALIAKDRATILSAPKLTCLNNQTANIRIVTNSNYIAYTKTYQDVSDGVVTTNVSQTIGQIPEGIVLEITPNVSADKRTIRLTVHPQVTELLEMDTVKTNDGDVTTQLPTVTQRSLDTTVSIKNEGTMVLGGLMRGSEREKKRGVPGLSSVPVIGGLFKNKNNVNDRSNLMIFICASILDSEGAILKVETAGEIPPESIE